ncbi:MAG: D-glycero-beta-D-manno-heptose-7-phosphate kinase [Candidatus Marinimicrobia bacterium]|nr:D-glycero-beta-D-manno-heptose-7-phosphate kinase [Candidatus Neomarinimicrobiota bacterium]|tara:strand:- start:983 stop:1966 length:984 start_codon:yes stop_codon:yes gene_type:complete
MISADRYNEIESRFSKLNLLVIGDLMIDNYLWGDAERISPEAPVPVVNICSSSSNPGGAGNVVTNLRALSAGVAVLGVVGDDKEGARLKSLLLEAGADVSMLITDPSRPTTVKTRIIAHNQQVVRTDWEDDSVLSEELQGKLVESLSHDISSFDGVIVENYDKGLLNEEIINQIFAICSEQNKPVYVDPKTNDFFAFKGVTLMKPNAAEVSFAMEVTVNQETVKTVGHELRNRLDCKILLITLGERGMSLFDDDGFHTIPTRARAVHDVSGAGDTVISVFSLAHLSGASPLESAEIANFAAGRVCEEVGVVPITKETLHEIIAGYKS